LGGAFRGPEWHAVPDQRAIPTRGETIGREQRDGLNARELSDIRDQIIEIHVRRFHVDFPALGTVPTAGRRVAASPVTLEYIATKVVTTHVRLS
jgi:hypothetical protein